MTERRILVDAGFAGRLDRALDAAGVDARALAEGRVFVGRVRVREAAHTLAEGDEIVVYDARAQPSAAARVVGREGGVVAAEKPAGTATIADHHGASGTLAHEIARLVGMPAERLHATSRLDVGVSGVVLFATDDASRERLAAARASGAYLRHYVAVAARAPVGERGVWDAPIGRARDPRLRQVGGRDATRAETCWALLATSAVGAALLAVEPRTGRTHQIRVHAAHAAAPLVGDGAYGGPRRLTSKTGAVRAVPRVLLHAAWVEVPSGTGRVVRFAAPLPADFVELATLAGFDADALERSIAPL